MSKKCDECKRCAMNDDMTNVIMSSADWQRSEQRHLRREKRFVAIIVLLIILLVGSNISWLIYESSFDDMTETYTVEQDGAETNNSVIRGYKIPDEHKEKLNKINSKPVICLETKNVYKSAKEASDILNIPRTSITANVNKRTKHARGFHFEFYIKEE